MITFGYRNSTNCKLRALIAIAIGVAFLFAQDFGDTLVRIAAGAIIVISILQLLVFGSIKALAGLDTTSVFTSAMIVLLSVVILFNPFSLALMRVIAGICLIVYGVNELRELPKVKKAITDDYGPVGEDKGVDEQ